MSETDETLAAAAARGDRAAYESLLRRHYDRIFALAWRLTTDYHEAQDLTQDLCLSLPRRLTGYRAAAHFRSWLYRVVVNLAHDRRRIGQRRLRYHQEWGAWETARRNGDRQEAEATAWLLAALRSLPRDLRDTAALSLDPGLTQAQIGLVLGISSGTVAWRMSEVKKHLRRHALKEDVE